MSFPINSWTALGAEYAFWAFRGSNGYAYGTVGQTLANGSSSSMGRLKGIADVNITPPTPRRTPIEGDGGKVASITQAPIDDIDASLTTRIVDVTAVSAFNGTKVETAGDWKYIDFNPYCITNQRFVMIFNNRATTVDGTNTGAWEVVEVYNTEIEALGRTGIVQGSQPDYSYSLTLNPSDRTHMGIVLSNATNGLTQSYWRYYASPYPIHNHTFIGDGTAVVTTLPYTPVAASAAKVVATKNGTPMTYTTDYSVNVSTRVVTFVAAPAAADIVQIKYQFETEC